MDSFIQTADFVIKRIIVFERKYNFVFQYQQKDYEQANKI